MTKKNNFLDKYTIALIKENLIYFILLAVNIAILISVSLYFRSSILEKKENIKKIQSEIDKYDRVKKRIDSMNISTEAVDKFYQQINMLIPNKYNMFETIAAIERLARESNFATLSYTVKPENRELNQLEITIAGTSSPINFLKFLENYNFSSGKLITINEVTYNNNATEVEINLTFYAYDTKEDNKDVLNIELPTQDDLNLLSEISSKINLDIAESSDNFYPIKENPFVK
ncbi:MAG: hypothetical protein KatS3mg090_0531 [Patescibacteria group bacterium]|nr:MAG: hypothetical protein KatS3mg090_0531 [Patescibacteria group bacterium]